MMMMFGTFLVLCSNSWFSIWMGLEINLMAFIPLINKKFNLLSTESSMKYFLVQALASSILLMSIILLILFNFKLNNLIMNSALLMKMGAAPFHFWIPSVSEGLDWMNLLLLLTWQKIAPFVVLFNNMNYEFLLVIIMITSIVGAVGGLNQTSLRKLMTYSSINHLSWMLLSILYNKNIWIIYFFIYSLISLITFLVFYYLKAFYINQLMFNINNFLFKFLIFCNFLSLGGLPPFLGFLPKWMILESLSLSNPFLLTILVMMTIVSLNFYLRMTYFAFSLCMNSNKWILSKMNYFMLIWLSLTSFSGLLMILYIYTLF
uniref:NADH dehydrogenase subunit 2 n=1 Tax=Semidalis macleodi TaxID=2919411 RepID=UPI001FA7AB0E|nr:NADH dehydrogenase subunit 2 [Semidalis macleodi]ULR86822.1 NADH dehydrogenase subunit 2 [Semidalis macleodi]